MENEILWKLNAQKYMRNINDNAVQGHLSDNAKDYRMKYFRHEIFAIYSRTCTQLEFSSFTSKN